MRSRTTKQSERVRDEMREQRREREDRAKPKTGADVVRVPHDPVNESVILAAALVDPEVRRSTLQTISADSFFGTGHAEIWLGLQELERRKLSYDPATIVSVAAGIDTSYIETLVKQRPMVPPNLRYHIDRLHFDRARIELARGPVQEMLEAIRDPFVTAERLRAISTRMSSGLQGYGSQNSIRHGSAVAVEQMMELKKRRSARACYPFGIPGLDLYEDGHDREGQWRLVPGTAPTKVTVVTGLSGSGKSTTLANAVLGQLDSGRRVLLGAWEQGSGMMLELCAAISLGMSRTDLMTGRFSDADEELLEDEMKRLGDMGLSFFELEFGKSRGKSGVNDRQLDQINQVVVDSGCDVFVADLFRRAIKETNPDDEEQALYRMQAMAQDTNSHFILVQQQRSKEVEQRQDKRPTRDNIKGSSAWVEIADLIIGWHRPAQWKNIPDTHIEGLILKQRYGVWPECVELEWNPEFGTVGRGKTIRLEAGFDDSDDTLLGDDFFSKGQSGRRGKGSK